MSTCRSTFKTSAMVASAITAMTLAGNARGQSVIWNNGPLITQPNGGCPADPNPHNDSELQNVAPVNGNVLGFTVNNATDRLADDFTLLGNTTISSLTVYAYQTGSTTTSTFTGMFVQFWNGRPGDPGSAVVAGNVANNILSSSTFSGIYRSTVAGANVDSCARPLMACTANFAPAISLGPGTFWVEWGLTGSLASGPFAPPVTLSGAWYTGNARQSVLPANTWANVVDNGNGLPGDMPFILKGNACGLPVNNYCYCAADMAPVGAPDAVVNTADLLLVINNWAANGQPQGPRPAGDAAPLPNGDCIVNTGDLLAVINSWGACPPAFGACCLDNGSCLSNQTVAQCLAAGGTYKGNCTTCAASFCPIRPPNNACLNAQVVTNGATNWTNAFATTDGPFGGPSNGCEQFMEKDVWFNYQATCNGAVIVDTLGSTGNTDTVLAVYDTWACPPGALLGCNDDISPTNGLSSVTVPVSAGQQIKIRVGSFIGGPEGAGVLNVACVGNDICAAATAVTVGSTVTGSLSGSTADTIPDCMGIPGGATVFGKWYTVIGNGHTLTADTCTPPAGGSQTWNGKLSVYCGAGCSDLTCVNAVDNNTCSFFQESVSWCSAAGQKYWIVVHTDTDPSTQATDYVLHISDGTSCGGALPCGCFQCPAGALTEGEPCAGTDYVDAFNGGCNVTPNVFSAITVNGPAICGLGSTYTNAAGTTQNRDTDWYQFTLAAPTTVHIRVSAQFTALVGFIAQPCPQSAFITGSTATTNGDACAAPTDSPGVLLQPGTYVAFIAPSVFTGFPCTPDNTGNKYWIRLVSP